MRTDEACVQLKPGKLYDQKTVSEAGEVPVINQSENGFHGYHSNDPGVNASFNFPVVTFANHTCAMRVVRQPFSMIQNVFPKVGKPGVTDTVYFYYASIGRVNLSDYKGHHPLFRMMYIPIPPLQTQRKIAAILSAYDDLIENNLRRIKILEEMAQNLYREWFVKFRFPGYEKVKFVDSPLGMIPEGWVVRRMEEVLSLRYGKALKKDDRSGGDIPVYGSSGVVGYHDTSLASGPGIVVGRKGNVGSVFWSEKDFFVIDTAYYVESEMPLIFLYYDLQGKNFLNNDAAVPGLSRNQAYSLPMIVPPADLLSLFSSYAKNLVDGVLNRSRQNDILRNSRDLLLPRLVSGEVDVSDLDIEIPEGVIE